MAKWISHRGESIDAPENTLDAFKLSLERATDGMECDVRLTADGEVVVSHDNTTLRTGNAKVNVETSTYEELLKVRVYGAKEDLYPNAVIPLLRDTFQYLGENREYYIELKGTNPALLPAVQKVVENSGINPDQIIFISFNATFIRDIKRAMPQYKALWLDGLVRDYGMVTPQELVDKLEELGVDGIDASAHPETSPELIEAVHKAGKIYAIWTVDNPYQAEYFVKMGVDSVTSNRAGMLKEWAAKRA